MYVCSVCVCVFLWGFAQLVFVYKSWEIWKDINGAVFKNKVFLSDKVALIAVILVKVVWLTKDELYFASHYRFIAILGDIRPSTQATSHSRFDVTSP